MRGTIENGLPKKSAFTCDAWNTLLLCILLFCISCQHSHDTNRFSAQLSDCPAHLRPLVDSILYAGEAYFDDGSCQGDGSLQRDANLLLQKLQQNASNQELLLLSDCEVPLIRSFALAALLPRPISNRLAILEKHLNDTALVFTHEKGVRISVLSLALFNNEYWTDLAEKQMAEEMMLSQRPFERASYLLLKPTRQLDTFPGLYLQVQKMTANLLRQSFDWRVPAPTAAYAPSRLAMYQRPEDVALIVQALQTCQQRGSDQFLSHFVLINYPNTGFDTLLPSIGYPRVMINLMRNSVDGSGAVIEELIKVVEVIAARRNEASARQLEMLFIRSPYHYGGFGGQHSLQMNEQFFHKSIASTIRKYPCMAYRQLFAKTAKWIEPDVAKSKIPSSVPPIVIEEVRQTSAADASISEKYSGIVKPTRIPWPADRTWLQRDQ